MIQHNDREETEWIGNDLGASEHIYHENLQVKQ